MRRESAGIGICEAIVATTEMEKAPWTVQEPGGFIPVRMTMDHGI
jgi:hypothetical protein